ncbi:MAG TPA: hypothetical protein VMC85_01495 [Desulfomonilaceae bacterium]|nr:hypothetical protein [Desulfomonilaceae bacterium]
MKENASSPVDRLRKTLRRYQFLLLSLVTVSIGLGLVIFSVLSPTKNIIVSIANDVGLALFTSGLVGLALEYQTREQFIEELKDTLSSLTRASDLTLSMEDLGVIRIYPSRAGIDLMKYLKSAKPKSEIRFIGVSLRTFSGADPEKILVEKLREGCKIKMLTMDPDSETVAQRAREEKHDYQWLMSEIQSTLTMYENMLQGLPITLRANFELGCYTTYPTQFMFCVNNVMIVSPYLAGNRGYDCPHYEIESKKGGIYKQYSDHFNMLWGSRKVVTQISLD